MRKFKLSVIAAGLLAALNAAGQEAATTNPLHLTTVQSNSISEGLGVTSHVSNSNGTQTNAVLESGFSSSASTSSDFFGAALTAAGSDSVNARAEVGSDASGSFRLPALKVDYKHAVGLDVATTEKFKSSSIDWKPLVMLYGADFDRNLAMGRTWSASGWFGGDSSLAYAGHSGSIGAFGELGLGNSGNKTLLYLMGVLKGKRGRCAYLDDSGSNAICVEGSATAKLGLVQAEGELAGRAYYEYNVSDNDSKKRVINSVDVGPQASIQGRADLGGKFGEAQATVGISIH